MDVIDLDFETYFDKEFTLRKLTTEAYIRDPRFVVHGCGFRLPDGTSFYATGHDQVAQALSCFDWSKCAALAHHAHFDGLILSHVFGVRPAMWLDTMLMARLALGPRPSVALAALCKWFKFEQGKTLDYNAMSGRHIGDDPALDKAIGQGCLQDLKLTRQLFDILKVGFPPEELRIIDMTIRWFTEPLVAGDADHYEWLKEKEWLTKQEHLYELGVTEKDLGSNAKFQELLFVEGVQCEMKPSKTGGFIHAFAKTDDFMQRMLVHENPRVVSLAEARLAIKSSIDETRAGRLAGMARRGRMPVYLNYCGAATLRWSGGDSVNWQNFRRAGELRKGVVAPPGCLLGTVDKSQVEMRFLNFIAGQQDVVERLKAGSDPYLPIASRFYGREISRDDKPERGLGKQLELSCGYGAGGASICATAKRGSYGPAIELAPEQGKAAATLYRSTHPGVTQLWREGDMVLSKLAAKEKNFIWRDVVTVHDGRIWGPNGSCMVYDLEWNASEQRWYRYVRGGAKAGIWGGVVVQNLMEFLCRIDLAQGLLRLQGAGIRSAGTIHDEAWFVHPIAEAEALHARCCAELAKPPSWLPDIPLAVEGSLGERYEK